MKVKVCGITRLEDASHAEKLGAWAVGFVFHPASRRFVEPTQVRIILDQLKGRNARAVGVFVNSSIGELLKTVETSGIDTLQLHGNEDAEYCRRLRAECPDLQIIKAFRPKGLEDLSRISAYADCDGILIDSYVEGSQGGTGVTGDWELARKAKQFGSVVLSGGLNESNISEAVSLVGPMAVDLSSGLESSPGIKSQEKMDRFFNVLRGVQ